jgi:hypothetical protein
MVFMSQMDIAQVLIAKVNVNKAIIFIGNPAETYNRKQIT